MSPPSGMGVASIRDGGAVFYPEDEGQPPIAPTTRRPVPPDRDRERGPDKNHLEDVLRAAHEAFDKQRLQELADALGLPADAVESVAPGWADEQLLDSMKAGGSGWRESRPSGAWVFPERDGKGQLIGLSLRAPDGRKGAPKGARRGHIVPGSLASLPGPVLVVEGASDVIACTALGLAAVGRPSNAGGAEELEQLLKGREVLVAGENDAKDSGLWPGRDGAWKVAGALAQAWSTSVSWALPPDDEKDMRSWYTTKVGTNTCDTDARCAIGQQMLSELRARAVSEGSQNQNTADRIIDLAKERFWVGRTMEGEPFAVRRDGPAIASCFRGNKDSFRATLASEYRKRHGRAPNSSALADALTVLEGEANEASRQPVAIRVAALPIGDDGDNRDDQKQAPSTGIVIDLGDDAGRAIVVKRNGWEIVERSPVLFRRTALTVAIPEPTRGGDLGDLRDLLNVDDESWPLVVGWIVSCLLPEMPHPILMLGGEQGTGKSTAARLIASLIDPSVVPLRSAPRDVEGWAVEGSGSWIVPIDNISNIPGWFSDTLCKAVTGDGVVKRALYTDSSLAVLSIRRCIILTSIDAGALRGDLGDRLLLIDLEQIPDGGRRTESELQSAYDSMKPVLLGSLLDALASVIDQLPRVSLGQLPRMADFAQVLAALDQGRPDLTDGRAMEQYIGQGRRIAEQVIESNCVAEAICKSMESSIGLSGTAGNLRELLRPDPPPTDWPKNGQAMHGQLKRIRPAMLLVGIDIKIPSRRTNRGRVILIRRLDEARNELSQLSPLSRCDELGPTEPRSGDHGPTGA